MNAELSAILRELRRGMEELYGDRLERLVLFGSRARGDADPDSDIDVLVVLKGEAKPGEEISMTGYLRSDLSLKYDTLISCVYLSSERYATGHSPLLQNVRREGVLV